MIDGRFYSCLTNTVGLLTPDARGAISYAPTDSYIEATRIA